MLCFVDGDSGTIINGPIYIVDLPDEWDATDLETIGYALDNGSLVTAIDVTAKAEILKIDFKGEALWFS